MTESQSNSVTDWIVSMTEGDQHAAQQIFDRYYKQLTSLARRQLAKLPPQVADHEGAVNSALRSFFSAARAGRFPELHDREQLYKLLATITMRKATKQHRQHYRRRSEGDHRKVEVDLAFFEDRSPGPEEFVIFRQECQSFIDSLDDDTLKQITLLMMEGLCNRDIGEKMSIHIRSVQRKSNLILSLLSEYAS